MRFLASIALLPLAFFVAFPAATEAAPLPDHLTNLVARLEHPAPSERLAAIREAAALAKDDAALVVPALVNRLMDAEPVPGLVHTRTVLDDTPGKAARRALVDLGPAAIPPLLALLDHPDAGVRWRLAGILGLIGDARAVSPLLGLLRDDAEAVRNHAGDALARLGEPAVQPLIDLVRLTVGDVPDEAVWALGEIGDLRAVRPVWEVLIAEPHPASTEAASALIKLGEPTVGLLLAVLEETELSSATMQIKAMRVLQRMNVRRAVDPLLRSLFTSPHKQVRAECASVLADIAGAEVATHLMFANMDPSGDVTERVGAALYELGEAGARALEPYLFNPDPFLRQAAAWAISRAKERALRVLREHLDRSELSQNERQAMAIAIYLAGGASSLSQRDRIEYYLTLRDWDMLFLFADEGLEVFFDAIDDPDPSVREGIVNTLGIMGSKRSIPYLIERLSDADEDVAAAARFALAFYGRDVVDPLLEAMRTADVLTASRIARILESVEYRPPKIWDRMDLLLAGERWDALFELGEPLENRLLDGLREERNLNRLVRTAYALNRLHEHGFPFRLPDRAGAEELPAAVLSGDPDRALAAVEAAGGGGDFRDVPVLLVALFTDDPEDPLSAAAARALARVGDAAIDLLIAGLQQGREPIEQGARRALAALGRAATPPLAELLYHENQRLVTAARRTLEAMDYDPLDLRDAVRFLRVTGRWDELAAMGDAGLRALRLELEGGDAKTRRRVMEAVGTVEGEAATALLLDGLKDADREVRRAAGDALKARGREVQPRMERLVREGDPLSAAEAARVLRETGYVPFDQEEVWWFSMIDQAWEELAAEPEPLLDFLLQQARSTNANVRARACIALLNVHTYQRRQASGAILNADDALRVLAGPDPRARAFMAGDVNRSTPERERLIPALLHLLGDGRVIPWPDASVRRGWRPSTPAEQAARALSRIGEPAVAPLFRMLQTTSNRFAFAHGLLAASALPDERLRPALRLALSDRRAEVRSGAARCLGTIGNPEDLPDLLRVAADKRSQISGTALKAIRAMGTTAVEPLISLVGQVPPNVLTMIITLLGELRDPQAVPVLLEQTQRGHAETRSAAVKALAYFRHPNITARLVELIGHPDNVLRWNAEEVLVEIGTPAIDGLIEQLASPAARTRASARKTLRIIAHRDYGDDADRWRTWWAAYQRSHPGVAAPGGTPTGPDASPP